MFAKKKFVVRKHPKKRKLSHCNARIYLSNSPISFAGRISFLCVKAI